MPRIAASASDAHWVPVTGSLGFRGRRHRRRAVQMLLAQGNAATGTQARPGGGVLSWAISQAIPMLMRRADGRVLAWVWRDDPTLLVAMARIQEATPQLRAARAMMPMEYDDTQEFRGTYLGVGEKLEMAMPERPESAPFATYTWDTGTHLVTLQAVCSSRERFGTVIGQVDELARSLRIVDELTAGESPTVLRIEP